MHTSLLQEGCHPRISDAWRLRNDGRYLVAYHSNTDELRFKVLSPWEAAIAPFLDGTLDMTELRQVWADVVSSDAAGAEATGAEAAGTVDEMLDVVLEGLLNRDNIVALEGSASPSFQGDRGRLVVDFANYHRPEGRLDRPTTLNVGLTNQCATDCRYCYAQRRPFEEMTLPQWRAVFDEISDNEIYIVDVTGGDPFARADTMDLLREMARRDYTFFLSTKCSISRAKADALAEMGIGVDGVPMYLQRPFQLSIDSADSVTASDLVRRDGYLQHMVQSVKNTVDAGLKPRVKAVLTALNADAPEGLVALFSDLGVTDFQFVQYGRSHFRHDDELFLSKDQKLQLHDIQDRLEQQYPDLTFTVQVDDTTGEVQRETWENWHDRAICSGGRVNMLIQANGDVTLCEQVPHDDDFVVGNVLEQGVIGAWNAQKLRAFNTPERTLFKGTPCFSCPHFAGCHNDVRGYCYRDALVAYGTMFQAPPHCPAQTENGLRQI